MSQDYPDIPVSLSATVTDALPKRTNDLRSCFSGATEPPASIRVAYMLWADTTTGLLKQRNGANSAWNIVGSMSEAPRFRLHATLENITASTFALFHLDKACKVVQAVLVPDTATAGSDGSNNYGFQFIDRGTDGTGTDTMFASAPTTNGAEATAKDAYVLTPDQNETGLAAGTVVEVQVNVNGTAPATTDWTTARVEVQLIVEME